MPLLAAAPIALILGLMLALQWPAARAGLAGLALAALLAPLAFGFGTGGPGALALGFAGVLAEGGFTAAAILWILWPALALHRQQEQSGAMDALRAGLARLTPNAALQALAIGWFMALFFEGAAGFGTPIALAAPLLAGLGIAPVQAVVLALLGHAAGVSFGALGTPVLAQVALTGLDAVAIASRTALLHTLLGGVLMLFFLRALAGALPQQGWRWPLAAWGAFAAISFLLPSLLLATTLGPELATLGAALGGGLLFALLLRLRTPADAAAAPPPARGVAYALWPYAVLVALVLATRALPPLAEVLREATLEWKWQDRYTGRLEFFTHPGTLLFLAFLAGARLQGARMADMGAALRHAARRLLPVTIALLAMLCLSRLMLHAGMIAALERAAVQGLGSQWPLLAPAVGALGSFVTGSATASNVLFTSLQAQTAQALGLPVALLVAAQGFGAAIGNIVCPHNVVAGAATVGLAGQEAQILRRTLVPCALYLLLGGALVALLAALPLPME
jgi:lactate permease